MNIKQLFQLESCLENLSANFMHTEIDYKTKLKNNFMKSKTFGFNDLDSFKIILTSLLEITDKELIHEFDKIVFDFD